MAGRPEFREVMLEGEVLAEVDRLARDNPDLGALVIECTDLVPFAHAIQARLRVPVFDIVTLTTMVYDGLTRRPYPARPRARSGSYTGPGLGPTVTGTAGASNT
jgi:hypothetical protein